MSLTNAMLKSICSNLRTIANGGDWRAALSKIADVLDLPKTPTPSPAASVLVFRSFDLRRRPVLVLHCADTPVTARSLVVDGEEGSIDGPIPLWWE
jgi:hypothetical protein